MLSPDGYLPCMSCGRDLTPGERKGVPFEVDCCRRCWRHVPVVERLKLVVSVRDRSPGGFLNELAELVIRAIAEKASESENDFDS